MGKSKYPNVGRGWAWQCDFGMCHWAKHSRKDLVSGRKPSTEAKLVAVRLVPEAVFRALVKKAGER